MQFVGDYWTISLGEELPKLLLGQAVRFLSYGVEVLLLELLAYPALLDGLCDLFFDLSLVLAGDGLLLPGLDLRVYQPQFFFFEGRLRLGWFPKCGQGVERRPHLHEPEPVLQRHLLRARWWRWCWMDGINSDRAAVPRLGELAVLR